MSYLYRYSYDLSGVKDVSKEPSLLGAVEEQLLVGCYFTAELMLWSVLHMPV